jgi:hypothetical protein
MTKEQKVNYVKFWLQCFGDRDNEGFNKEDVNVNGQRWSIWLQYNFDDEGDQLEPYSDVSWSNKLVKGLSFEELTEEQLDSLIEVLKKHQTHW